MIWSKKENRDDLGCFGHLRKQRNTPVDDHLSLKATCTAYGSLDPGTLRVNLRMQEGKGVNNQNALRPTVSPASRNSNAPRPKHALSRGNMQ
eukprot:1870853-Prymnesium_polylepis.1